MNSLLCFCQNRLEISSFLPPEPRTFCQTSSPKQGTWPRQLYNVFFCFPFRTDPSERLSALTITGSQIVNKSSENTTNKRPTATTTSTELHLEDKAVNTEMNFYSLQNWHGASWQKCLPSMYLPRKEKYNAFASSKPVRSKARPARFRHTDEMANLQN